MGRRVVEGEGEGGEGSLEEDFYVPLSLSDLLSL